jgi:hypothetical protein
MNAMEAFEDTDDELAWRTADAIDEESRWMAVTAVARIIGAGDDGVSLADWSATAHEWGSDPYEPYRLLDALQAAAEQTGMQLPWGSQLCDGDIRVTLTDRQAARRLCLATESLPRLEREILMSLEP